MIQRLPKNVLFIQFLAAKINLQDLEEKQLKVQPRHSGIILIFEVSDSDFKNRNTDLFHHSSPSRPACRVVLEVGWPTGFTNLPEADRAIVSTYR